MAGIAEMRASGADLEVMLQRLRLNSAEELYYYRIFKDKSPQPAVVCLWLGESGERGFPLLSALLHSYGAS